MASQGVSTVVQRLRERPGVSAALAVALCTFAFFFGLRELAESNAKATQVAISQELHAGISVINEAENLEDRAAREHLSKYVSEGRLNPAQMGAQLATLTKNVDDAVKEKNPDKMLKKVRDEQKKFGELSAALQARKKYIATLDERKAQYGQRVEALGSAIAQTNALIAQFVQAGYFPQHFVAAQNELARAQSEYDRAMALKVATIENGMCDYVAVYDVAVAAVSIPDAAATLAKQPAEQRAANSKKLAQVSERISDVISRGDKARKAANQLSSYSKYALSDGELNTADADAHRSNLALFTVQDLNGMRQQRFADAAKTLANAELMLDSANRTYGRAIDTWHDLQTARNNMGAARVSATSAISSAESEISRYSENDQSTAESSVADARRKLRDGDSEKDDDPIAALRSFQEAARLASNAESEVDTADHTVHVSTSHTDDDDSGSTSSTSWGNSGWSDSGSGSGSLSGSGNSGMDDGPSGGMDEGPSGGIDGDD